MVNAARNATFASSCNDSHRQRRLSIFIWCLFYATTVCFRVHAWVLLCSFLADFSLSLILFMVVINAGIILYFSSLLLGQGDEPVLLAIYSLVLPTTYLKSVDSDVSSTVVLNRRKETSVCLMAAAGTVFLLLMVWVVVACVWHQTLGYSPLIRIRRHNVLDHAGVVSVLAVANVLSSWTLHAFTDIYKEEDRQDRIIARDQKVIPIVSSVVTLALQLLGVVGQLWLLFFHSGSEHFASVRLEKICQRQLPQEGSAVMLKGYTLFEHYSPGVGTFANGTLPNITGTSFSPFLTRCL